MMMASGVTYWIDSFRLLVQLPEISHIVKVPLVTESSLALWLLVFSMNEAKWRARADESAAVP